MQIVAFRQPSRIESRPVLSPFRSFHLGASGDGGTPVPIPNTAVKPVSADGSSPLGVRE